jgi:hypothetical protein
MRLKAVHIVFAVVALIAVFMVYAVYRSQTSQQASLGKDDAFIEEVRARQSSVDLTQGVGSEMPVDAAATGKGPNLEVAHVEVDLGVVPNNKISKHPFTLKNTGNLTLNVYQVTTSCECTKGIIPPDGLNILPGEEAVMDIAVDPRRIPGFEATRYLTIVSNDPDTPSLQLAVTSHVEPEFAVEPREIDFGVIDKGTVQEATVVVRQLQEERLVIEEVNSHADRERTMLDDEVSFTLSERPEASWKTPGKAEYEVKVTLNPNAPAGTAVYAMYLKTNVKRVHWHSSIVRAVIEAPYTLSPQSPEAIALQGDGAKPGTLTITGQSAITVDNLVFDASKLTATLRTGEDPKVAYIDANLTPNPVPGQFKQLIRFDIVQDGKTYTESIFAQAFIPKPAGAPPTEAAPALPADESSAVSLDMLTQ